MLTKIGGLLKVALSNEFKGKIKTDKAFRQAYADLNRAGGTGAQAEELFRKFYGSAGSGAAGSGAAGSGAAGSGAAGSGFSGFKSDTRQGFRQGFSHGYRQAGFSDADYGDLFKRSKNAKYKAGLAAAGLGAYAGYNYFRNRRFNTHAN